MSADTDKGAAERALFEAHWLETYGEPAALWSSCYGGKTPAGMHGKYILKEVQSAWIAWQAARALAPAPQGPSDAELEAARAAFDWDGWTDPKAAQRGFARAVLARWDAAPQPPAALSPERVREIVVEAGYDLDTPDPERAAFINGLRHGESAHGITGAPDGHQQT